jgi:hypothetical protein
MTDCSRDSDPPELLEQLGNSADDWMLEGLNPNVQKDLRPKRLASKCIEEQGSTMVRLTRCP